MSDTAPALKTMFRLIKNDFLKEIISVEGKPIDINWELEPDKLHDALYHALALLHRESPKRFAEICTNLFDINAVCQDNRRGRYVIEQIESAGLLPKAMEEMHNIKPGIHWFVAWVFLRMPKLWDKLCRTAHIKQVIGLGGQKKYIKKPASDEPSTLQQKAFESEFLKYMEQEKTLITYLHVQREDLDTYARYVLHVNPFPKEVEQFDNQGAFKLQLDQNAEGFTIVHHKGDDQESYLRIKCAFNTSQKKHILDLFAKFMLATEICDKPQEEYPIASFNPTYDTRFSLAVTNPLVDMARVSAAEIEIVNPADGFIDELYHKCPKGNLFERLAYSCKEFPVEWRHPIAWEFDITIFVDPSSQVQMTFDGKGETLKEPKRKTYHVRVTENNMVLNCQNEMHRQIILDLLAENGIKNVFKKEYLAREYRK